jgi:regulator of sigma E protease
MQTQSLLSLLEAVLSGIGVLFLFSLAVFIHELGHFLAARWMGLTIDAFSLGFGPALWKRQVGATEYRIGTIPFGGYVALPQLDPTGMSTIQGKHGDGADPAAAPAPGGDRGGAEPARLLKDIAPWRRIVVSVAGPLGNILLAVVLAWIVRFAPADGAGPAEAVVGTVARDSGAFAAGLRAGDRIVSVNGNAVHNWNEFLVESHLSGDASNGVSVAVYRDQTPLDLRLPVVHDATARLVRVEGVGPRIPCVVGSVVTNSPAARAGLQAQDVIQTLDGVPLADPEAMIRQIEAQGARPLAVGIRRGERLLERRIEPVFDAALNRHLIGIVFDGRAGSGSQWLQYRKPWLQLRSDAVSVVRILRALVAPRTKGEARRAAGSLSGPLVIVVMLWYQVRSGLIVALAFLRFLCVNLALLNLLPLPVLDGGHIVFALYETVARRKPNARLVNMLSNTFAVLLIGLMVLLLFRDAFSLKRIFGAREPAAQERAAPADASAPVPADPAEPRDEAP